VSQGDGFYIKIRRERPGDEAAVRRVEVEAFGRALEADMVDRLRETSADGVSLVAEVAGEIVGHILFEPARIESERGCLAGAGLGPLAVLPAFQRQGIGSALMRAGLEEMRRRGQPYIMLVGHPTYYPRFGFRPGAEFGVRFDPDLGDVFMLYAIDEENLRAHPGVARNWLE
jgi:putative acetyltransferase